MVLLRVSVEIFVCPSSRNRRKKNWLIAMFGSVDGFPVVVLPLFMSMALSLVSSLYNVQTFCKDVDSFLIFIFVFLSVSGIFRIRNRLCLLPDTELF